ncbi:glycoside hydrolase family 31 protein [Candidatus Riflebacteria bacterium]
MNCLKFESLIDNKKRIVLKGDYFRCIVELFPRGIFRVFFWHRLEDANKRSPILKNQPTISLKSRKNNEEYVVESIGGTSLKIRLNPLSLKFGSLYISSITPEKLEKAPGTYGEIAVCDGLPYDNFKLFIEEKPGRFYYGLGERTGFLNKKGRIWTNWTTDEYNHGEDRDPLYQAHPFVMGLENGGTSFGLYLDETWKTSFDLAATDPEQTVIKTYGPTFDLYLIPGPHPGEVVENFASLFEQHQMPPLWAFGQHQCRWSYPDQDCVQAVVKEYRQKAIPLEAIWLDLDYMEGYKVFTSSKTRFPDFSKMIKQFKQKGVKTVVIVDPCVKKEDGYHIYESGKKEDVFVKNLQDQEYVGKVWPQPAVWPDFSLKKTRDWWAKNHSFYFENGVSGIWNDMNEPAAFEEVERTLPTHARQGLSTHLQWHNLYGYQMCAATFAGCKMQKPGKRPFILTRSGFSGIHQYAWVWTGDNSSNWGQLEMSIPMMLNLSLSLVAFCGADIGGFSGTCNGELLSRWTWLGVFHPFMRNHSGKTSRRQEPWAFGREYEVAIKKAIEFRYTLLPYLYTLAYQCHTTGHPIIRPMFFHYPEDDNCYSLHDQFLVGSDLLVAPATRPGQKQRLVYLPEGGWEDFFSGQHYYGPCYLPVATPLDSIPLFQRSGSAIPFTTPALYTSDAYWKELCWKVAPAEKISGIVYADSGDGPVDGKILSLEGGYSGSYLELKTKVPWGYSPGRVEIQGMVKPKSANIPFKFDKNKIYCSLKKGKAGFNWD